MSRTKNISDREIYVQAERKCSDTEAGDFNYWLFYHGNYELCSLSAEDAREIIACLQHALDIHEKGGQS